MQLVVESVVLVSVLGAALWGFLGFLIASRMGLPVAAAVGVSALLPVLGLVVLLIWARARPTSADPRSTRPQRPDWSWRRLLVPPVAVAAVASVLLLVSLRGEWVGASIAEEQDLQFSGGQLVWSVLPVAVTVALLVGAALLFARLRLRWPLGLAACACVLWATLAGEVILLADAANSVVGTANDWVGDQQLVGPVADALSVEAVVGAGSGLVMLAVGGLVGFVACVWMGVDIHRGRPLPASAPIPAAAPSAPQDGMPAAPRPTQSATSDSPFDEIPHDW